jgi:trimethylamine:corrinoid methyltransferase-like protein
LPALLGFDELDALHWSALQVLDKVGLHVADENCLQALEGHEHITRKGSRLHFDPDFVHTEVADHRDRSSPPTVDERAEATLSTGHHATHYVDVDSDEIRPLDWEACAAITRAIDGLRDRGLRGNCPGAPQDIAPGLREVAQALIGWENCEDGGVAPATTLESAELIFEMNDIMGRPSGVGIHVVSPLRLEGIEYEMAVKFAPRGVSVSIGSMPIMGVTAPVYPAGAFVVAVAEVLGSWLVIRLFLELEQVGFSFDAYSADMRSGGFIFGNPEQKLLDLVKRDVNAFYNTSKPPRAMYTMARRPGAQSCAEMAALATVDALCGFRNLWGVNMAVDELCSVEQYVLALEMMHSAMRIGEGVRWDRKALAMDAIAEVCGEESSASFMTHDSTLDCYRDVYWQPELWDRRGLAVGEWGELEPARERAKEIAKEAPGRSEFRLEEEKAGALREVYGRAEELAWPG